MSIEIHSLPPPKAPSRRKKPFFYLGEDDEPKDEIELPNELPLPRPSEDVLPQTDSVAKDKCLTVKEHNLKRRILKNVVLVSIAFMFFSTSLLSVHNLQSPIKMKVKTATRWAANVSLLFSAIFLSTFIVRTAGSKWAMAFSMLGGSIFVGLHFYPTYMTLVPGAMILGLSAGSMWSAKSTYLTKAGRAYGKLVGEEIDSSISRFFGFFFFIFHWSQVIGNVLSSSALPDKTKNASRVDEFAGRCGFNFCPRFNRNLTSLMLEESSLSDETTEDFPDFNPLALAYFILTIVSGGLIVIWVDSPSSFDSASNNQVVIEDKWETVLSTVHHLKNPSQILLIPLTVWCGMEQAFILTDFAKAFVLCHLGIHMVSYVMVTEGISDALSSLGLIPLITQVGRGPLLIFGATLNIFSILLMFLWKPNLEDLGIFFLIPGIWGIADAIWRTQIQALYGNIFPENTEAAFSNYRLWETCGYLLAYIISFHACMPFQLYTSIGFLSIGIAGYFVIEFWEKTKKTQNKKEKRNKDTT